MRHNRLPESDGEKISRGISISWRAVERKCHEVKPSPVDGWRKCHEAWQSPVEGRKKFNEA